MLTGERTDSATVASCSARSSAISAPVLPMPTTRTRHPGERRRVAIVAAVHDATGERRLAAEPGPVRVLLAPVATTTAGAAKCCPSVVVTCQRPSRGAIAPTSAPTRGAMRYWAA
jgi:hypothetical protein